MIIIGAGQAGLLAARSLHQYAPTVYEIKGELPNNHAALLRFRSNVVSDLVGMSFKKVFVQKGVLNKYNEIVNQPTINDINAYSYKTTGQVMARSIMNMEWGHRFIAPDNLISHLALNVDIKYNHPIKAIDGLRPVISTMPMPSLMKLLNYDNIPDFIYHPIWNVTCKLHNVDVYQTIYVPHIESQPYRVSVTGNKLIMEYACIPSNVKTDIECYLSALAIPFHSKDVDIPVVTKQPYGKIVPIDERTRQEFIVWATDKYDVYSLGRYATWRNILLDDVVNDIKLIQQFVTTRYQRNKHLVRSK